VSQEHASGEDHGDGVGLVGTHDILTDVSTSGLEEGVFLRRSGLAPNLSCTLFLLTRPMLHPGTIPGPPTRAAPMLEVMFPYKLGMTMTSNC
jgi:hypothetical protein